jgi:hypothetical protein
LTFLVFLAEVLFDLLAGEEAMAGALQAAANLSRAGQQAQGLGRHIEQSGDARRRLLGVRGEQVIDLGLHALGDGVGHFPSS